MTKQKRRKLQLEVAYLSGHASGYDGDEYCIPDEYMDDAELSEAWIQGYDDAEEEMEMEDE